MRKQFVTPDSHIFNAIKNMTHKDVMRSAIARGLDFEEAIRNSHPNIVTWLHNNFDRTEDETKLVEFDIFMEEQLSKRGIGKNDPLLHKSLRLSTVNYSDGTDSPTPKIPVEKEKKVEEPKSKKVSEKDEKTGVRKGTKKNLTYELTDAGLPISEIIEKVKKEFPDAEEKSIKIWNKRRINENQ